MRKTILAATATCLTALLLTSCGGSDSDGADNASDTEPTSSTSATEDAAVAQADPESAIQDYFAAQRAGDAAAVCALEDESLQVQKYGEAGQACLDDAANNQPQSVWADPVKVVSIDQSEESATAVLEPNASSPAQATITLVATDGGWLVTAFY